MARSKVKPLPKILGLVIIGIAVYFGIKYLNSSGMINSIAPKKGGTSTVATAGQKLSKAETQDVTRICVVTWGGYAGGQYFNGGFKASKESRYYKEYGILVEFILMDDWDASRAAWKSNDVNLQWITADAFPTEAVALKEFNPKIVFQADWSRGGDAIVVRPGINKVNDLRGKKIAVAYGTPSHTFILWLLEANNMVSRDVELVQVKSAIDAAAMAKSGSVDAAVVWSPDDDDVVQKMTGWKKLKTTKEATNIIADVFYAKESYINENEDKLRKIVEGWMRGAAEINSSPEAKQKAADILAAGLGQDANFCLNAINNTRLCTFGDNKGFFTIDRCSACVTGEQLYQKMSLLFKQVGVISETPPSWRLVSDTRILRQINLAGVEHEAEGMQMFSKATVQEAKAEAFASKTVSIVFPTGSFTITDEAKYIIDRDVAPTLKAFGAARVRVEGNTDNVGGRVSNQTLSQRRASSAIQYLVQQHGFDANRFIEIGNGPDVPVADNVTEEGRAKNRRTEFQLLN
jgi:NitT/TauT family transport system substrate-binding protein